jgi:hypothetical protein
MDDTAAFIIDEEELDFTTQSLVGSGKYELWTFFKTTFLHVRSTFNLSPALACLLEGDGESECRKNITQPPAKTAMYIR